ncbi:MAG: type II toxin-antitoxin system RatA family toxin [Pseudomonadota bacterium]
MPKHVEKRILKHTPEQMFDLVADVARYPEFLPWCLASRIVSRHDDKFVADLVIGFKLVRERFTSEVMLTPHERIDVRYTKGPLKYLENHWQFLDHPDGCTIDFYVEFEFKSAVLQNLIGALFGEAVRRMVRAFETRADELYGTKPTGVLSSQLKPQSSK